MPGGIVITGRPGTLAHVLSKAVTVVNSQVKIRQQHELTIDEFLS